MPIYLCTYVGSNRETYQHIMFFTFGRLSTTIVSDPYVWYTDRYYYLMPRSWTNAHIVRSETVQDLKTA